MTSPVPSTPSTAPVSTELSGSPRPDRTTERAFSPVLSQAQLHDDRRAEAAPRPRPAETDRSEPARASSARADRKVDTTAFEPASGGGDESDANPEGIESHRDAPELQRGEVDVDLQAGLAGDVDGNVDGDVDLQAGLVGDVEVDVDGNVDVDGDADGTEANADDESNATDQPGTAPVADSALQPIDATIADSPPATGPPPRSGTISGREAETADPELAAIEEAPQPGAPSGSEHVDPGTAAVDEAAVTTEPDTVDPANGNDAAPGVEASSGEVSLAALDAAEASDRGARPNGEALAKVATESAPSGAPATADRGRDPSASAGPTPEPLPTSSADAPQPALLRVGSDPTGSIQPSASASASAAIDGATMTASESAVSRLDGNTASGGLHAEALDGDAADELWGQVQRALHRVRTGPEGTELRLRLHPAELGELLIQVRAHGEQLSVRLVTSSAVAHQTLVADQQRLTEELAEAGFADGTVDVSEWGSGTPDDGQEPDRDETNPPTAPLSRSGTGLPGSTEAGRALTDISGPSGRRSGLVDLVL